MTGLQQNNRVVYAMGETVLDLVSDGGYTMKVIPGGSVLNASVSLGRMGTEIFLLSEFGGDKAGDLIEVFLTQNKVHTDFCIRSTAHKTSLALAFMDEFKKASYSFYIDSPEKLVHNSLPGFTKDDFLLFGSFYSVKSDRKDFVLETLSKAVKANATIYYDLNFRSSHAGELESLLPVYMNNISASTIVKGSDEDFYNLFRLTDPAEIYDFIKPYCKVLIITRGSEPLYVLTPTYIKTYKVPSIRPVSTIGAGDNFNAGFIFGLSRTSIRSDSIESISETDLDRITGCGLAFATETCLSEDNYVRGNFDADFWKKYI